MILLTNDLQATIRVELADVSCAEPPLLLSIHKEVLLVLSLVLVVAHGDIGPSYDYLPPGVRLVSAVVTSWGRGCQSSGRSSCIAQASRSRLIQGHSPSSQSLREISEQMSGAPTRPVL